MNTLNPKKFFPTRYQADDFGIVEILYRGLLDDPERTFLHFEGRPQTIREIAATVAIMQAFLDEQGLKPNSRVAVMLDNHPAHIALIYALILSGITWVPINARLRSTGIRYIIEHCSPDLVVMESGYRDLVVAACSESGRPSKAVVIEELPIRSETASSPHKTVVNPDHVLCIIYTSGTTGPPKGVMFTHRMMRIASEAALMVADVDPGDRLFLWEPIYHIGGAQMLLAPFLKSVELLMFKRFSATHFWREAMEARATHLHYLGGILDILIKQPLESVPAKHDIRVAWGAGVSADAWQNIIDRFGFRLRECYGMTEASSFTTVNALGKPGSIGRALPWLEIELFDEDDRSVPIGGIGQIVLSTRIDGVFLPCYLNDVEASRKILRNGKLYTGDMARRDADGDFFFVGRSTDSIRVRGENVSAWEVERVFVAHPAVAAAAAVAVKSDIGEQNIKIFVQFRPGMRVAFEDLCNWAASYLASYQIPTYYVEVAGFELTPSERIRKYLLSNTIEGCWSRIPSKPTPVGRPR